MVKRSVLRNAGDNLGVAIDRFALPPMTSRSGRSGRRSRPAERLDESERVCRRAASYGGGVSEISCEAINFVDGPVRDPVVILKHPPQSP
jgi:hypothetical protein